MDILCADRDENQMTSKCLILLKSKQKSQIDTLVFNELLPDIGFSGKIDHPFDSIRLNKDTLFIKFMLSPYGQNYFDKWEFTFLYNTSIANFF